MGHFRFLALEFRFAKTSFLRTLRSQPAISNEGTATALLTSPATHFRAG